MIAKRIFGPTALLLAALATRAADADPLDGVLAALARVERVEASFVEERYLQVMTAPLVLEGRLSYTAPDRLERWVIMPLDEHLAIFANRLTIEADGAPRRVITLSDNPVLHAFAIGLLAVLRGDRAELDRKYSLHFSGDLDRWEITLIPNDADVRAKLSSIRLAGAKDRVTDIFWAEASGDHSAIHMSHVSR